MRVLQYSGKGGTYIPEEGGKVRALPEEEEGGWGRLRR
jgi:hypothetical protein